MSLTWNRWWMRFKDLPSFWPFCLCCFLLSLSCDRATHQPSYSLSREELKNWRVTFLKDSLFQISPVNPVSSLATALGFLAYQFRVLLRRIKKQCFYLLSVSNWIELNCAVRPTRSIFFLSFNFIIFSEDSKLADNKSLLDLHSVYIQPCKSFTRTPWHRQFVSNPVINFSTVINKPKLTTLTLNSLLYFRIMAYTYNLLKSSGDFLLWGKTNTITLVENIETVCVIVILTVWE